MTTSWGLRALFRRRLPGPAKALLWAYGAYLLLINVFLNLPQLPKAIDPPDHSAVLTWSYGYSIFPGWAAAHNFYLRVEDDNLQFGLSIEDVRFWFSPVAFFHQTFHITTVTGTGVVTRLRLKRTPAEVARQGPSWLADLPPIAGFAAAPLKGPPSPPFNGDTSGIWTVDIEDVHAFGREFWAEGVRYDGELYASGGFRFQPMTSVDVDARLAIQGGDVALSGRRMAQGLHGELGVRVNHFNPLHEPGPQPLRFIVADLALEGQLQNAQFLDAALRNTPAPKLASSPGHFQLRLRFDRGQLTSPTHFQLHATDWQVTQGRYRSGGNYAQMDMAITETGGHSHADTAIAIGPYEVDDSTSGHELIEGEGFLLHLTSDRLDVLERPLADLGFQVQVDAARMPDLTVINAYLPHNPKFEVLGGSGELTGAFVSPATGAGHGTVMLGAHGMAVRLNKVRLAGDLSLEARVSGVASNSRDLGILGRDELEGTAKLSGAFTLSAFRSGPRNVSTAAPRAPGMPPSDLAAARAADHPPGADLASFSANADVTLHPFLATEITGAPAVHFLHFLSGELKIDGHLPSLSFLDSTLVEQRLRVEGGAGRLTLDARLSHGVLGRGSALDFTSRGVSISGRGLHAAGDLRVAASVDETKDSPSVSASAEVTAISIGTEARPAMAHAEAVELRAHSPELDLVALKAFRPEATLAVRRLVLPKLSSLNPWLPSALRFDHGRLEISLVAGSPPSGSGTAELTLDASAVRAHDGPLSLDGDLVGDAELSGLAEAPWDPAQGGILARSRLQGDADLAGRCHLTAKAAGEREATQSNGHFTFRASAAVPPPAAEALAQASPESLPRLLTAATAQATIRGEIDNLGYLNHFLGKGPLRVRGGTATIDAQLAVAQRELSQGSQVTVDLRDTELGLGPLWLTGPLHLAATLGAKDSVTRAQLRLSLPTFSLRSEFLERRIADGSGLAFVLQSATLRPARLLVESTFKGEVGHVDVPDLAALASYFPDVKDLRVLAGSASVSAQLDHPSENHGEAHVRVEARRARLLLAGKPLTTDLEVNAVLRALAEAGKNGKPLLRSLDVAGTRVDVDNADFPEDRAWWLHARVVRGELGFGGDLAGEASRVHIESDLSAEARDALPLVHLFGRGLGIPPFLDGLLAFKNLKATGAFDLRDQGVVVPAFQAEGNGVELKGRLLLTHAHTRGDFLFDLGPFSMGLDVKDKHTGVQLLGPSRWYREQLQRPLE